MAVGGGLLYDLGAFCIRQEVFRSRVLQLAMLCGVTGKRPRSSCLCQMNYPSPPSELWDLPENRLNFKASDPSGLCLSEQ